MCVICAWTEKNYANNDIAHATSVFTKSLKWTKKWFIIKRTLCMKVTISNMSRAIMDMSEWVQYKYDRQFWGILRLKKSTDDVTLPVADRHTHTHTLPHSHKTYGGTQEQQQQQTTHRDREHSIIIIIKFSGFRMHARTHPCTQR